MKFLNWFGRRSSLESELWSDQDDGGRFSRFKNKNFLVKSSGLLCLIVLLYYLIGMVWINNVDADLSYRGVQIEGEPVSVTIAASLIDREVNQNRWTANDPFFMPGAALDNMPNFQLGIMTAIGRYTLALRDHLGRSRGTSAEDPDLTDAAGSANYQGDKWYVSSAGFTPASESQYRAAAKSLWQYAGRVKSGDAQFDVRADNLMVTLALIQSDLGAASAEIEDYLLTRSSWGPSFEADDVFYRNMGRLYAYNLILESLFIDAGDLIAEKKATKTWNDMMTSFRAGAGLDPWIVMDGDPDGLFLPSHLSAQGFYLLRARAKLSSMMDILSK